MSASDKTVRLSIADLEQLEAAIAQVADLAGSQGLAEIERLLENALLILERSKLTDLRQPPIREDCLGREKDGD